MQNFTSDMIQLQNRKITNNRQDQRTGAQFPGCLLQKNQRRKEKMKSYYIIFEKSGKKICGCWRREKDAESALLAAEFSLICHYSNVEYDNCYIASIAE